MKRKNVAKVMIMPLDKRLTMDHVSDLCFANHLEVCPMDCISNKEQKPSKMVNNGVALTKKDLQYLMMKFHQIFSTMFSSSMM